ncbi:uncharacterized protein LOC125836028 [Solanum verrucosum]|uniref:uncharacterized protein LOC125836028 n=1 Tax=Solanum verrucosum TaxID=315347 RepID=UPI0020D123CE|nr:uncharacterized protein LOC125836028 [Solanum verrucosum]
MVQANREVINHVNLIVGTAVTRMRDFTRMNLPEFHGLKVEEDPQEFEEIHKIVEIMRFTPLEKFSQWKEERAIDASPLDCEKFKGNFLEHFFSLEMREVKFNKYKVSNLKPQGGGGSGSFVPVCQKCGKSHSGKCLAGMDICYGCGKSCHKVKDCPLQARKSKDGRQAQSSYSGSGGNPRQNRFYTLQTRHDHTNFPNVVTSMLKVFHFDIYDLFDVGVVLSFVTPYVAMRFDVCPDILLKPFLVSTLVGDSVVAKRLYRNFPVSFLRVTHIDLVELDMPDFNVIPRMD